MALVKTIKRTRKDAQRVHAPTECLYSVLKDAAGQSYLQLDTYGTEDRKRKGQISQSMQFDRGAAAQLKVFIAEIWPDL